MGGDISIFLRGDTFINLRLFVYNNILEKIELTIKGIVHNLQKYELPPNTHILQTHLLQYFFIFVTIIYLHFLFPQLLVQSTSYCRHSTNMFLRKRWVQFY